MSDDKLADKIFELVNAKQSVKPKRKKREMTPEARAKMLQNLAKGREKSLRNRQERAKGKSTATNQGVSVQTPVPVSVVTPPTPASMVFETSAESKRVESPPSALFETSTPVAEKKKEVKRVSYSETVKITPKAEPKPVVKEEPKPEPIKAETIQQEPVKAEPKPEPDEDNTPHTYSTWQGGNLW